MTTALPQLNATPEPAATTGPSAAGTAPGARVDALYLHLPFCFHLCHYCDFFSVVAPAAQADDLQSRFTDALCGEISAQAALRGERLRPHTVFAGGGTPTLLQRRHWATLLRTLHDTGVLRSVREFTVEANPETVDAALIRTLADGGVNRVSIGAQSFDAAALDTLERHHDPANVARAVALAREAGIDNVSLDLIFGIPEQTLDGLHRDLDAALALQPEHLSIYGLTYEPNTQLNARLRAGRVRRVDEDLERDMYAAVMDRLAAAGFRQYELSNFCRVDSGRDLRSAHNLHYWRNANWLGVGPAAASHLDGHRWRNRPSLPAYLDSAPHPVAVDVEHRPADERLGEALMMGLRLDDGVPAALLAGLADEDPRRAHLAEMAALGLVEHDNAGARLTRQGKFVADSVIVGLL